MTSDHFADECTQKWNNGSDITLKCFPMAMDSHAKFGYTLFFILVPWPFFIYEFFTSQHYDILVTKGARIVVSTFFGRGFSLLTFDITGGHGPLSRDRQPDQMLPQTHFPHDHLLLLRHALALRRALHQVLQRWQVLSCQGTEAGDEGEEA